MGQLLLTDPICSSLHVIIWAALQPVPEQKKTGNGFYFLFVLNSSWTWTAF